MCVCIEGGGSNVHMRPPTETRKTYIMGGHCGGVGEYMCISLWRVVGGGGEGPVRKGNDVFIWLPTDTYI